MQKSQGRISIGRSQCSCLSLILKGNGIITADGDLWKTQRKAGLRFFSNANLKTLIDDALPPILADTESLLDEAAKNGTPVDLQNVLLELTTRLMGSMAYDVRGLALSGLYRDCVLRKLTIALTRWTCQPHCLSHNHLTSPLVQ